MPVSRHLCRCSFITKKFYFSRLIYTVCFFFFYLAPHFCLAHREKIDSLKKILPSLGDSARVDCLLDLSIEYLLLETDLLHFYQPYRDTVLYYDNLAYEEAKKINYVRGIAESFCPKAALYNHYLKDYKEMEKMARESLKWFALTGNKKKIEIAYWQVAAALFFQQHYEEAIPYLDQSYYWSEKNVNKDWMYNVLGFKYENYRDIGEYDKAFEAFQKTQQLNLIFDGKKNLKYEFYVLGELYRRIENYSAALNYYRDFVQMIDLNNDNIWFRISYPELFALNAQFDSAQYYYNLIDSSTLNSHELRFYLVSIGELNLLKGESYLALGYLLRGLKYHREAGDMIQVRRALIDIGKTYAFLKQDKEALAVTREALDFSLSARAKQNIRDAYQILYEIYQRRNQSDSAFKYYTKYVAQKEVVATDVMKGKFAAYNYEQQIELLNKEKQLQQQQLNQTAQQRKFLMIGITGILVLGIFLMRNIILKRKNEMNRRAIAENDLRLQKLEIEKTKAEFQQQAAELQMQALRAQMNPHFIFNSLSSINMFILENNKLQASDYLSKFSKLIRLILHNSQEAFIELEKELEALQLYLELESLRFANRFEYKIIVEDDIDTSAVKVPPLIIQPYAENAIWHGLMHKSVKGYLEVKLYQQREMLFCKITDDGIGRNKAAELKSKSSLAHKSMGIRITGDRIAMLQQENKKNSFITITDLVLPDNSAGGTEVLIEIHPYYD